jgi:hypothetical protein
MVGRNYTEVVVEIEFDVQCADVAGGAWHSRGECGDVVVELRQLQHENTKLRRRVSSIMRWLEANQPDVFRRGLWDAINAADSAAIEEIEAKHKGGEPR